MKKNVLATASLICLGLVACAAPFVAKNDIPKADAATSGHAKTSVVPDSASDAVHMTAVEAKAKNFDVQYPQLSGLSNVAVERKLNRLLQVTPSTVSRMGKQDTYTGNYQLMYAAGPLLEIDESSYDYPQGAAHGMPGQRVVLMNLQNGQVYHMSDLFVKGSNYLQVLSKAVQAQDTQHYLAPSFSGVKATDGFAITRTGIQIFFTPYEWTPFALGFPTYEIPFSTIQNVINHQSALWKALQQPATKRDIETQLADIAKIQSLGYIATPVNETDTMKYFAQGNTPSGTPLLAFSAVKKGNLKGNIFFFLGRKYLGTDTYAPHWPVINMYPDGVGTVAATYEPTNQVQTNKPFTAHFTWNGHQFLTNPAFPRNFAKNYG